MTFTTPSLLITEDDRAVRETLRDVFQPRGFHTITAADGIEALSIVHRTDVHLVLLDLQMPGITGIEAARRVKKHNADLPCILISGALNDQIIAEAEKVPLFSILSKPVSCSEVTDTVNSALREVYDWVPPV